jgi:hypothetical protein
VQLGEVQIANRLKSFGERTVSQVFRRALQPGGIFDLCFQEPGDVVAPAAGSSAMISWAARAVDGFAGRARRALTSLAFSVGHGCFADRFARHDFHSEALRHETSNAQARCLKRQLPLPVSTMSQ